MCVLYHFFSSVYKPLTSYLIHISCFEYVWIVFLLYFLFFVHVCHQWDGTSSSWARAGCKKTLSLIHNPCEIKFIHSLSFLPLSLRFVLTVSLSFSQSLSCSLPSPSCAYTGRHEFILFFSFFFCLYICMCAFFFFFHALDMLFNSYLKCFECVWMLLFFLCACILSNILVTHGLGLDGEKKN